MKLQEPKTTHILTQNADGTQGGASNRAGRYWVIALFCIAAVYVARVGWPQTYPAFGGATSTYIVSAESLANHTGYRLVNFPDAPPSLKFPIGYPFLLSLIFHILPFGAGSTLAAQLLTVAGVIVWLEASHRLLMRVVSPLLAACAVLAMGVAPLAVDLSGQILSDMVFAAILVSAMVVATEDLEPKSAARPLWRGIILGILAACAILVRTIGFTVVFGLALEMIIRRRWSRLTGFALSVTVALGPWMLWCAAHKGGTFHTYAAQNNITWRTPVSNFWQLATDTAPNIGFAPFGTSAWKAIGSQLHLTAAPILLGLAMVALVVIGWLTLLLQRHVIALVLAPYMAVVFMWWWEPSRFVVPIIPLFILCAIVGARTVLHRVRIPNRRVAFATALAVCIVANLGVDAGKLHRVWRYGDWDGPEHAQDWAQMQKGLNWIKRTTPGNAEVYCVFPEAVYLFTSRHTLQLDQTTDLDSQLTNPRSVQPLYVFATLRRGFIAADELSNAPIQRFIDDHPGRIQLQWSSTDHLSCIYKLIPPNTNTSAAAANADKGLHSRPA